MAGQVTPRENAVADLAAQEASHLVPRHLADCCCQVHHHLRRLLGAEHDDGVEGGGRLSGEVLGSPGDEAVPALSWFEDRQRRCRPSDGGVGFAEHDPMREPGSLAMRLDAGEQRGLVRAAALERRGAQVDDPRRVPVSQEPEHLVGCRKPLAAAHQEHPFELVAERHVVAFGVDHEHRVAGVDRLIGEQSSHVRLARSRAAGDEHVGLGGSEHGGPPFSGVADPERATLRVDLPTAVQDVAWDERADA